MNTYEKWKTLASKYLVNDRWLKLRADTVETPDGNTLDPFYVLEFPDWINCLVVDNNDNALMIRQYRHGAKEYVLEIIGGSTEQHDVSVEDAIRRELNEELGYIGGEVILTGVSYANPANQTNKIYSYFAFGGSCANEQALEPGENIVIEKMPFVDMVQKLSASGVDEVFQSYNITNLHFALRYIKQSDNTRLKQLHEKLQF
ncbi:MAG: NUDIX hydrolase [Candidatus Saccharimonadales bacterium]